MKTATTHDPRLRELLVALHAMVKKVKRPYAVGGALAMAAYGYPRHTSDVDAFMIRKDLLPWLRAAREVGLNITQAFEGHHYMAWFSKHADPNVRIDLLFPSEEIYLSGVRKPVVRDVAGMPTKLLPVEILAAVKFASEREKDKLDFDAMFKLGLFEPQTVAVMLNAAGEKAAARAMHKKAAELERALVADASNKRRR
ncbi:MAG: hypothetical protein ACHREM_01065 [Polyangiales bacterium]